MPQPTVSGHPVVFVATDGILGGADGERPSTWAVSRDPEVMGECACTSLTVQDEQTGTPGRT